MSIDKSFETTESYGLRWAKGPFTSGTLSPEQELFLEQTPETEIEWGHTVSRHQEAPADLPVTDWWHGVYELGTGSSPLRDALEAKDIKKFKSQVEETFWGAYYGALRHYDKNGIYPPDTEDLYYAPRDEKNRTPNAIENGQMFHVLQIDTDIIEMLFSENDSTLDDFRNEFGKGLNQVLDHAEKLGVKVTLRINQFANPENSTSDSDIRFAQASLNLESIINPQYFEKVLRIEPLPISNVEYWKGLIDKVRTKGESVFRFNAEWSRMMDDSGNFNEDEFEELVEILEYAKQHDDKKKIDIMLCLSHFSLPRRYKEHWASKDVTDDFVDYSDQLIDRLHERDVLPKSILTFNELLNSFAGGYLEGGFPPFTKFKDDYKNVTKMFKAIDNTVEAHTRIYDKIKNKDYGDKVSVGFSINMPVYGPNTNFFPFDHAYSYLHADFTELWLDRLLSKTDKRFSFDFVGLQYYSKFLVGLLGGNLGMNHQRREVSERYDPLSNGWTRFPEGIIIQTLKLNKLILEKARQKGITNLPEIKITEMGLPTPMNPINELAILRSAIKFVNDLSPLKISTVLKWGLNDNYELDTGFRWDSGFGDEQTDGEPKPKKVRDPNQPEKFINLEALDITHPEIHFWTRRLAKEIQETIHHRLDQVKKGVTIDAEFTEEMQILEYKLKRNNEFLKTFAFNLKDGIKEVISSRKRLKDLSILLSRTIDAGFGEAVEATDALFNRRSALLSTAGFAIDSYADTSKKETKHKTLQKAAYKVRRAAFNSLFLSAQGIAMAASELSKKN